MRATVAARRAPRPTAAGAARGRRRLGLVASLVAGMCYLALAVAVHFRLFDALDTAVRGAARPDRVWGRQQVDAARVVNVLAPAHLVLPVTLIVLAVAAWRRSFWPIAAVAAVGVPLVVVTLVTKHVMSQWSPEIASVDHGGFPSGHVVSVVAAFSVPALLSRPRRRWLWVLPVLLGLVMGTALIVADVHPATDVIGAGLLAVAVLACPLIRVPARPARTGAVTAAGAQE